MTEKTTFMTPEERAQYMKSAQTFMNTLKLNRIVQETLDDMFGKMETDEPETPERVGRFS